MSDQDPVFPPPPPGTVGAALEDARKETARANYPAALAILEDALRKHPDNAKLREARQEMTTAALRHESAVERNQVIDQVAQSIEVQVAQGDLEEAARGLQDAVLKFGRHNSLIRLQERLEKMRKQANLEQTVVHLDQGRAHLDNQNWQAALREAERVLRRDPGNVSAREVQQEAKAQIERQVANQDHQRAIDQAAENVARLIKAAELPAAANTLKKMIDKLGPQPAFDELQKELNQARADLQTQQRLEWAQRRLNETESLIKEANRLSLQGKHDAAVERLKQASELNPDHPDVAGLLSAAEAARKRNAGERRRTQEVQQTKQRIRQLLDDLQLDEAEALLQTARRQIGEDAQLQALQTRFERLREAEHTVGFQAPGALDQTSEAEALARQKALAKAYSWKQTVLYPFRGDAFIAAAVLAVLIFGLDLLKALPEMGWVFGVLRWLVPVVALAAGLQVVRETFTGHNVLPAWKDLFSKGRYPVNLTLLVGGLLLVLAPVAALVVMRGRHELLATDSGPAGFLALALLVWIAVLAVVLAGAAAGSFGNQHMFRLVRHLRAVGASEGDLLSAVNALFAAAVTVLLLRIVLAPAVPWIGGPAAVLVEAYTLVCAPHLVGVVVRNHHVELSRIYR